MKTLPRALTVVSADRPVPSAPAVRMDDSSLAGGFVAVDRHAGIDTLRRAIARKAGGIALSGCRTGADIQRLAVLLSVAEAEENRPEGDTPILLVTDGIVPAPLSPQSLSGKSSRLAALAWDERRLLQTLRASRAGTQDGGWSGAFAAARAAVLLAAAAARVPAYDSPSDLAGEAFLAACERSQADGFFGRIAASGAQAPLIQEIYGRGA